MYLLPKEFGYELAELRNLCLVDTVSLSAILYGPESKCDAHFGQNGTFLSSSRYVFSYVPGGTTGMRFFSKLCAQMCAKTISKTLPV